MDKRRAIQIMTKTAQLYREHLEDQKVLFLYGLPKEVKKQLQEKESIVILCRDMKLLSIDTIFCI